METGKMETDRDELASYQVGLCLQWPDLSEELEPWWFYINQIPRLATCLLISCVTMKRAGSPISPFWNPGTQDLEGQWEINLIF